MIVPHNNGSNTFAVTIDAGASAAKHVTLRESRTIDQLDVYGNVWLESNTTSDLVFTVGPNDFTNHGNLRLIGRFLDSHHFTILGAVMNQSGATVDFVRLTAEDGFYNAQQATVLIDHSNNFPDGASNNGVVIVYPMGQMDADANVTNTGQFQILGGLCATTKLFLNDVNGIVDGFGVLHSGLKTQNEGTIYASGGSLLLHSDGSLTNTGTLGNKALATLNIQPAEDVNNEGTIQVNAGGGVAFDCNLVNVADANIYLRGGTLSATTITQKAGATFEGFGGITGDIIIEPNSVPEPNSIIRLTGPTNIVGDVTISDGATLQISNGQTLITGHTVCDGTIHLIGGTVIFQGGCDCVDCNIINEAGLDRNHFDINADGIEDFVDFASFAESWLWEASWY